MQLKAEQRIECFWHLCLRWFYEFGASRLAIRGQPLPSKPIIPVAAILYRLYEYYTHDWRRFFGSCRGDLPDLGVRAGLRPLSPPNPGIYPAKSQ